MVSQKPALRTMERLRKCAKTAAQLTSVSMEIYDTSA